MAKKRKKKRKENYLFIIFNISRYRQVSQKKLYCIRTQAECACTYASSFYNILYFVKDERVTSSATSVRAKVEKHAQHQLSIFARNYRCRPR